MRNLIKDSLRNYSRVWGLITGGVTIIICGYFLVLGLQQAGINYDVQAQSEYLTKLEIIQQTASVYLAEHQDIDKTQWDKVQENIINQEEYLLEMVSARRSGDWKTELHYAILQGEEEIRLAQYGLIDYDIAVANRVSLNRYLLQHQIEPKIPQNRCDGLNALKMFFEKMAFLVFSVCSLLFSIIMVMSEEQHGQIRFLLHQPFSRKQILLGKYLIVLICSLSLGIIVSLALYVSCAVLFGIGNPNYPIVLADGTFLSTGAVLLQNFLSAVFSVWFFSALGMLFSVSIRNEAIGVVLSVLIPVISRILQSEAKGAFFLLPIIATDGYSLVTQAGNNILPAYIIEIISAMGLLVLSYSIFRKKDLS